jgi:hypothetical protein
MPANIVSSFLTLRLRGLHRSRRLEQLPPYAHSLAVVYDSIGKEFYTFTEDKIDQMIKMFQKLTL